MPTNQDAQRWEELNKDYVFANQAVRAARLEVTAAFAECAAGRGTGPTEEQLDELERLERKADEAKLAADAFVRQVFGR